MLSAAASPAPYPLITPSPADVRYARHVSCNATTSSRVAASCFGVGCGFIISCNGSGSRHAQPVALIIAKHPAPTGPNQCWQTGITYLQTAEGWLYLAAILDRWSRRIVGWACGPTLHVCLVLAAQRAPASL